MILFFAGKDVWKTTEQQYKNLLNWVKAQPKLARFLVLSGKLITYFVYAFYPLFIISLIFTQNPAGYRCVIVPAISFLILSVVRYLMNFPRPYEKYDLTPLYNKTTKGRSFPSRHTFSIFIISVAVFYIYPIIGIVIAIMGLLLAISRVLCGVHFIKDVLVGMLSGIGMGLVGFYLI